MNAKDILAKYFGYTNFRLKQEEIINEVIAQKDVLALLPTGGGKSICYQVPALMQEGICIVISPLIALMHDQILFLQSKGIKSISISGNMNYNQIENALTNCIYGGVKFLYLSPERLQSKLVQSKLEMMNVNLIAIDEVHCISEWGHDFRPSYRHINIVRSICKAAPILALTATATLDVINDIKENLTFKNYRIIKSSFQRKNLSYIIDQTQNKTDKLLQLVEKIKSSVIVYVSKRKDTKDIAYLLSKNNYSASFYHAGLALNLRKDRQKKWLNNEIRILVATNAFGMGVNKKDVKLIVHMNLPPTIEAYFQEAGRAGRNGEKAYSFLLANQNDIERQKKLLALKYPNIKKIKETYQNLANFLQIAENILPQEPLSFNIVEFSKRYKTSNLNTYYTLQYLEKEEHLNVSYIIKPYSRLIITVNKTDLYRFQISNKYYDNFIKTLLRLYPNIFNNLINIKEEEIAKKYNKEIAEIQLILKKLEALEILRYIPKDNNPKITFLQARKDINNLYFDLERWKTRKEYTKKKLINLEEFIFSNKCRERTLLHYFGENKQDNCGKCDYCTQ